jgi:fermentation-respiration switch protein FrsA (DUF1100 family)
MFHPVARRILYLLGSTFTVLLLAYIVIAAYAAHVLTTPRREPLQGNPQLTLGQPYQEISFLARGEAVALSGWFIPGSSDRAIIFVHGKDGCRTCGLEKSALLLAGRLQQRGFNILMFDLRGHGQSGDGRFTFGLRERNDVLGAVDWLLTRGFQAGKIGIHGESMGAAAAIGAAATEPAIGALVSDSSFAELMPVLESEFPKASGLPSFFLPPIMLFGSLLVGEDVASSRPIEELPRIAPRPIFIAHAINDPVIPVEHAERLAALAGVEPLLIPASTHMGAFSYSPLPYAQAVGDFFDVALR